MSLGVGIHNNVRITKTTKNDKGVLVIQFKSSQEVNPIDALNGDGNLSTPEQTIMLYNPLAVEKFGTVQTADQLIGAIGDFRSQLEHITKVYFTSDKVRWTPFEGTDVTTTNYSTTLTSQSVLDKIYENLVNQFIRVMTSVVGESSKLVNVIFVRQSKAKHFPKLRNKYLNSQPFIEDATASPSKLKFSNYEIDNGLDDGTVAGGAQTPSATEVEQAASVFNS